MSVEASSAAFLKVRATYFSTVTSLVLAVRNAAVTAAWMACFSLFNSEARDDVVASAFLSAVSTRDGTLMAASVTVFRASSAAFRAAFNISIMSVTSLAFKRAPPAWV